MGIDPFDVPGLRRAGRCSSPAARPCWPARTSSGSTPRFHAFRDITYYADSSGTDTLQQRTRVAGDLAAFHVTDERFDDMASCAPPVARGWEYLVGDGAWDWDAELAALPELAGGEVRSPRRSSRAATTWSSTRPTSG